MGWLGVKVESFRLEFCGTIDSHAVQDQWHQKLAIKEPVPPELDPQAGSSQARPPRPRHLIQFTSDELTPMTDSFSNKIGEGGTSEVYWGDWNGKPTAVKCMLTSNEDLKMWNTEKDMGSKLVHDNIIDVIGYGKARAKLCVVFEFLPHSLEEVIKDFADFEDNLYAR